MKKNGRPKIDDGVDGGKIRAAVGQERKVKVYGLAKEQGKSASAIVRQAIDLYLQRLEKKRQVK